MEIRRSRENAVVLPAITLIAVGGCARSHADPVRAILNTRLRSTSADPWQTRESPGTSAQAPSGILRTLSAPALAADRPLRRPGTGPETHPRFRDVLRIDLHNLPSEIWKDTKAVYGSTTNLLILASAYGASLAVQGTDVDDHLARSLEDHDVFKDDVNVAIGALGNPVSHLGLAGVFYLLGDEAKDNRERHVGRLLFRALIINDLSTMGVKLAAWDNGPNGERFAFPSGHTSSTFTVASVLHRAYGPWVGLPLYGLGALVAVERLDDDEHHLSDVVMGAAMGLVIGHTVAGRGDLEVFGGRIVVVTDPNGGFTGLAWHLRL